MVEALKKLWNSDVVVLLWRILTVYLVLVLCRVVFYLYNQDIIGAVEWAEVWRLTQGGFVFDSASIGYAYSFFIIFSLLPFRFRERGWYSKMLFWIFIVVTGLVIALNFSDAVYFHYTQVRFTTADLFFANNDNTILLIGKFALENWYMVLLWALLTVLMAVVYRRKVKPVTPIVNTWVYFGVNLLVLLAAGLCTMSMIRGGEPQTDHAPHRAYKCDGLHVFCGQSEYDTEQSFLRDTHDRKQGNIV